MSNVTVEQVKSFLLKLNYEDRRRLVSDVEQEFIKKSPKHFRGTLLHNAKLNERKVREIRKSAYKISQREMSKKYCVSLETIKSVIKGYTWAHVK